MIPRSRAASRRTTNTRLHPAKLYGIYRRRNNPQNNNPDCWLWNVRIHRDGRYVCNKTFSDIKHGGPEAALEAAIAYRDEVLERAPPLTKKVHNQRLRRNNTSGVAGVSRTSDRDRPCYLAGTMLPDGTRLYKRFYIDQHGEELARQLAIAERLRQLKQVRGVLLHSPGAFTLTVGS